MNRTRICCGFLAKKTFNQYLVNSRITAHLQSLTNHTSLFFCQHSSNIHTSSSQYAGHNKWSKIKRKKAVADMERSQHIHRSIQQIVFAAKAGGTIDPDKNLKLSTLIDQARSAGIPKSNIETALKRASSKGESSSAESVLLDGRGPGGSLLLIEALTDNIRRTRPKIRTLMEKKGSATDNVCSVHIALCSYIRRPLQVDSLFPISLTSEKHEGGRPLFIIRYPETTLTSMFQMIERCAKSLILPWLKQEYSFHSDCQCNSVCWFQNELHKCSQSPS